MAKVSRLERMLIQQNTIPIAARIDPKASTYLAENGWTIVGEACVELPPELEDAFSINPVSEVDENDAWETYEKTLPEDMSESKRDRAYDRFSKIYKAFMDKYEGSLDQYINYESPKEIHTPETLIGFASQSRGFGQFFNKGHFLLSASKNPSHDQPGTLVAYEKVLDYRKIPLSIITKLMADKEAAQK